MSSAPVAEKSVANLETETKEEFDPDNRVCPPELRRLRRNDPALTSLRVVAGKTGRLRRGCFRPKNELDWRRLGSAVAANTHLRRLDLVYPAYGGGVIPWPLRDFFAGLDKNRSIRRLTLSHLSLHGAGGVFDVHLSQFLGGNPNLTSLSATDYDLGSEGIQSLSVALAGRTCGSLKYLDLSNVGITDDACEELVAALHSRHLALRSLELNRNEIRNTGCVAIAESLLKNPDSMLVRLFLDCNEIDDEGAGALADGLASNRRLKTLSVRRNTAVTRTGYGAFSRALCDAPVIDDILRSNHRLQRFRADPGLLSAEFKSSLHLNRVAGGRRAASIKVVMHHLVRNWNLDLFEGIPDGLVPSVLAMIGEHQMRPLGKNEKTGAEAGDHRVLAGEDYQLRRSALHRIVRLCPLVCERRSISPDDSPSPTCVGTNGNRKMRFSQRDNESCADAT